MDTVKRALNAIDKTGGVALFNFPKINVKQCPSLESLIDDDVGDEYNLAVTEVSMPNNIDSWESVRAGQFQPKDRDYNIHHVKRIERFEVRGDTLANSVLTGSKKNCIIYLGGKQ